MVLSWLSGFNRRLKFGVYCSDVSGAFDRVSARRLLDKLRAKGLREDMLKVFEAWLAERQAVVVCGCQHGDPICCKQYDLPRHRMGTLALEYILRGR